MGRGTLAMKMIEKEKSRKAMFQRRKIGIMKKAHELSTLCGVDCCLVVFSPNSINDNTPEIWPRDPIQVRRIIDKYKSKIVERSPKKYNMTEFFKDRKNKVEAEACKLRHARLRKLYPTWDFSFDNLNEEQLRMFVALLGDKIEHCKERINMLEKKRYIKGKQQELVKSFSGKSLASASSRSHLSFMHNNNSNSTTLSAYHHQTLDLPLKSADHHRPMHQPFYPNLMPWMMITQNNDSTETTQSDAAAIGHYDLMMRESYCPPTPPPAPLFYSNNNNSSYYPYLQNSNPHEANLQVNNNIPATPLMMQEFQSYHHFGYNQHDLLQAHHQKFNYMDPKK